MLNNEDMWYKNNNTDQVWWKETPDTVGEWIFSFDREREFNLFSDYPYRLTPEERGIFDKENPHWVEYFKDRK